MKTKPLLTRESAIRAGKRRAHKRLIAEGYKLSRADRARRIMTRANPYVARYLLAWQKFLSH